MSTVAYRLEIDGQVASKELLDAVQSLEIEEHADLADMLRLYVLSGTGDAAYYWRGREAFLQSTCLGTEGGGLALMSRACGERTRVHDVSFGWW